MASLPGKSFIPWCEVPIEEVAEDLEGFQEGFEVGWGLLVLDAQVYCLLQGLKKTPRVNMDFFDKKCVFYLRRALPDDGKDSLEVVVCQVVLQKHLKSPLTENTIYQVIMRGKLLMGMKNYQVLIKEIEETVLVPRSVGHQVCCLQQEILTNIFRRVKSKD